MKHKNISYQSNNLLGFFLENDKPCFIYSEVLEALKGIAPTAARQLLSDMVKRGLLMRIRNGLYYIIPFDQDPTTFMPDWHLLAGPLTKGYGYYIGYYSALQLHQLITQPSLAEMIVTNHQLKPATIKVRNVTFQFIYHNKTHFFGTTEVWANSFDKVMCKRLGFLLELLKIGQPIIEKLQHFKTDSYILLDTEMENDGKNLSRWSIRQNIDTETIENGLLT